MSRVYVGNLDPRATERELEDEFRVYGVLRRLLELGSTSQRLMEMSTTCLTCQEGIVYKLYIRFHSSVPVIRLSCKDCPPFVLKICC
uniref:RRM domain-containing protein n=1 Tax=Physcomitrium patens TaxID=3218 RepID=A0A7I4AC39_PHYPA